MAAAIGHPVDIPVMIRALACDYYRKGKGMSIYMIKEFQLSLDAGTDEDDPTAIVESYLYAWWTEPAEEEAILLDGENIEECLEHHHLSAKSRGVVPGRFDKTKYTWCRDLSLNPLGVDITCRR